VSGTPRRLRHLKSIQSPPAADVHGACRKRERGTGIAMLIVMEIGMPIEVESQVSNPIV